MITSGDDNGFTGVTNSGDTDNDDPITEKVELVTTWTEENKALDGSYYTYYKGTIRNIAGYYLDKVTVTVNFYDVSNNFLFSKTDYFRNLANSYTKDFSVTVYSFQDYYEDIYDVKYDLNAKP